MASGAAGEDTPVVPNRSAVVSKQEHENALTLLRLVMEMIALGHRSNPSRVAVRKLLFSTSSNMSTCSFGKYSTLIDILI